MTAQTQVDLIQSMMLIRTGYLLQVPPPFFKKGINGTRTPEFSKLSVEKRTGYDDYTDSGALFGIFRTNLVSPCVLEIIPVSIWKGSV